MKYTEAQKDKLIEDLWASSNRRLFFFLGRYTQSIEEREDTVSEAYAHVFKSLDTFKGKCKLETWLFQIARNIHVNKIRSNKCRKRTRSEMDTRKLMASSVTSGHTVTDPLVEAELNKIVDTVIKFKFKKRPVYITIMRDIFINHTSLSHQELSEKHGVPALHIRREKYNLGLKLFEKLKVMKMV